MIRHLVFAALLGTSSACLLAQQHEWDLAAPHIDTNNYYGVTSANGMIGIVSSPQPFEVKDVVLSGTYDDYARGDLSSFAKGFPLLNWRLDIDGERLGSHNVTGMTQSLNMRNAAFTTTLTKRGKAKITYTYTALQHLPYSVMMHITIKAEKDIHITAASVLQAVDALQKVAHYYHIIERPHTTISVLSSTAHSPTRTLTVAASTSFIFPEKHGSEPRTTHETWDNTTHLMQFSKQLKAGQTYSFTIVGAMLSSVHHDDPRNEAERLTIYAKLAGYESLLSKHNAQWEKLWKSDIQIAGDPQTQKEVRSMLYHLYAFSRSNTAYSPSPMGLSGLAYNGHIVWDTELWLYPAMLVLQPDMAKSMLDYRLERLPQAKHNASAYGFKGALFPCESAAVSNEETPVWDLSGTFEHYITACVAMAAWNYYAMTQDIEWLQKKGFPLLREIADFWASRVERTSPNTYHINNVVAADGWAENVNDDAFTNAAARASLQFAIYAATVLGIAPNPDWQHVYARIPILAFEDGTTKEHATYTGELIQQADVNLLAYPLKEITEEQAIKRDLVYYKKRIGKGSPAMTNAIFSILHSQLQEPEEALQTFHEGYRPNLLPPFGVIAETAGGTNPYFATAAGGMLQSMIFGFGGIEITPQGIIQRKRQLPKAWKKITLTGIGWNEMNYKVE